MFRLAPYQSNLRPWGSSWMDEFLMEDGFKLDVKKSESGYTIEAEVPGFTKEAMTVSYVDDTLTIEAKSDTARDEADYVRKERRHVALNRSIYLPNVDESAIKATLAHGVLTVQAPILVKPASTIPIEIE